MSFSSFFFFIFLNRFLKIIFSSIFFQFFSPVFFSSIFFFFPPQCKPELGPCFPCAVFLPRDGHCGGRGQQAISSSVPSGACRGTVTVWLRLSEWFGTGSQVLCRWKTRQCFIPQLLSLPRQALKHFMPPTATESFADWNKNWIKEPQPQRAPWRALGWKSNCWDCIKGNPLL